MTSSISAFDESNENVKLVVLRNKNGHHIELVTFGCHLRSWTTRTKEGKPIDVLLGYDTLKDYAATGNAYLGACCGRVCNRIRNGKFTLDGKEYNLAVNNGPNHLHGGLKGFDQKIWEIEQFSAESNTIKLGCKSLDGEEGYPGEVAVTLTLTLDDDDTLHLHFTAQTTQPTPINLTNHAYFNLNGQGHPSLANHRVSINANQYLPTDDDRLVTGEIKSTEGTKHDLRKSVLLGGVKDGHNFDACFVLSRQKDHRFRHAAKVECQDTGLELNVFTDQPAVQFYTGDFLDQIGKGGAEYRSLSGFCLETQGYSDAVNQPDFPSVVVRPGETYNHKCTYQITSAH